MIRFTSISLFHAAVRTESCHKARTICTQTTENEDYVYADYVKRGLFVHRLRKTRTICTQTTQNEDYLYADYAKRGLFIHRLTHET